MSCWDLFGDGNGGGTSFFELIAKDELLLLGGGDGLDSSSSGSGSIIGWETMQQSISQHPQQRTPATTFFPAYNNEELIACHRSLELASMWRANCSNPELLKSCADNLESHAIGDNILRGGVAWEVYGAVRPLLQLMVYGWVEGER